MLLLHKDAKSFYNAGLNEWKLCGCFTKKEITSLEKHSLEEAQGILLRCKDLDIDVIAFDDERYPERLRKIVNPPCVLYVKGEMPKVDDRITIGVVGTRSATGYGLEISYKLSNELASKGTVIVSGGAIGIDSAAHKGALNACRETILVMGCGINYNYLMENAQLRHSVSKCGALVSEYPPDSPPLPRNFPMRNRIISGLSLGIVVIEAGKKSGSLITANMALEQDRDLFAVPGNVNSTVSGGTNDLIKECAKPVTCANDILEEYSHMLVGLKTSKSGNNKVSSSKNKNIEQVNQTQGVESNLSCDAKKVFSILSSEPKHVDDITRETNLETKNLLQAITELELFGLIRSRSGRRYSK